MIKSALEEMKGIFTSGATLLSSTGRGEKKGGGWNVSIFIFYISAFFFSLVDNIKSHRQAKKK